MGPGGVVTVPSNINGLLVTSLGQDAFANLSTVTSVTIPGSVNSIGQNAFSDCTSLSSVTISNGVASIGAGAFYGCSFATVTIPNSVTSIAARAFYQCSVISNVTIGSGVISIGDFAFAGCAKMTKIYFLGNAPTADMTVFQYDPTPTVYYLTDTVGWNSTFGGCPTVPEVVSGDYLEFGVTPPVGLVPLTVQFNSPGIDTNGSPIVGWSWTFGDGAGTSTNQNPSYTYSTGGNFFPTFHASNSIGDLVVGFGPTIVVETPTPVGDFDYKTNAGAITITGYSGTNAIVIIPAIIDRLPVTSIGIFAFAGLDSPTSVTISDSVTNIGDYAFDQCSDLASVTIGSNVTGIGEGAFEYCDALTSVTIPGRVTSIGEDAFYQCPSLSDVTISARRRQHRRECV